MPKRPIPHQVQRAMSLWQQYAGPAIETRLLQTQGPVISFVSQHRDTCQLLQSRKAGVPLSPDALASPGSCPNVHEDTQEPCPRCCHATDDLDPAAIACRAARPRAGTGRINQWALGRTHNPVRTWIITGRRIRSPGL